MTWVLYADKYKGIYHLMLKRKTACIQVETRYYGNNHWPTKENIFMGIMLHGNHLVLNVIWHFRNHFPSNIQYCHLQRKYHHVHHIRCCLNKSLRALSWKKLLRWCVEEIFLCCQKTLLRWCMEKYHSVVLINHICCQKKIIQMMCMKKTLSCCLNKSLCCIQY